MSQKSPFASAGERLPEGTVLLNRYEIQAVLGSGGMATVYRARDTFLNRDVAVKRMAPWLADDEASGWRFSEEARAAAGLNHPNIVTIYDTIEDDGRPCIVMELVDGRPLNELIPLEEARAAEIARQLSSALDFAHSNAIIHCDIKPQNVLIEPSGRPRLLDFGIARAATKTWAMATTVLGTAAYMAPEVVEGQRPDARSDVYSLATLLYEMLSGRLPFEGDSAAAQTAQRLVAPPRSLSSFVEVSPATERAVMTALDRDPDKRPQTAAEFSRGLGPKSAGDFRDASLTAPMLVPPGRQPTTREPVKPDVVEPMVAEPLAEPKDEVRGEPAAEPPAAEGAGGRRPPRWLIWSLAALLIGGSFAGAFLAAGALFGDDGPDYAGYFAEVQATFDAFQSQHEEDAQQFAGQATADAETNKQLYVDFLRAYIETRSEFVAALQAIEVPEDLQDEHRAYLEATAALVFALDDFANQVEDTEPALVQTLDVSTVEQAEENQVRACNALQAAATERGFELNLACQEVQDAVRASSTDSGFPVAASEQSPPPEGGAGGDDDDDDGDGDEGRGNQKGKGDDKGKDGD